MEKSISKEASRFITFSITGIAIVFMAAAFSSLGSANIIPELQTTIVCCTVLFVTLTIGLLLLLIPKVFNYLSARSTHAVPVYLIASFLIIYMTVLSLYPNPYCYAYLVLILFLLTLYQNYRYIVVYSIGAFIAHIVTVQYSLRYAETLMSLDDYHVSESGILVTYFVLFFVIVLALLSVTMLKRATRIRVNSVQESLDLVQSTKEDIQNKVDSIAVHFGSSFASMDSAVNNVDSMNDSYGEVAGAIAGVAEDIDKINTATVHVNDVVSEVTESVEKLSSQLITCNNAVQVCDKNLGAMQNTTAKVQQDMKDMSDAIDIVQHCVNDMRTIATLLEEISSQTNLLSLNASIEAAHAGVNGRGFKVVAEEIRRLSEQSAESVQNVGERLVTLEVAAHDVAAKLDRVHASMQEQNNAISQVSDSSHAVASCNEEVASSACVIASGMERAKLETSSIASLVANVSASTQEVTASMESLSNLSNGVTQGINDAFNSQKEVQNILNN